MTTLSFATEVGATPPTQLAGPVASLTCNTCRKRKVKCGKELPVCSNCARLQVECDRTVRPRGFRFIVTGQDDIKSVSSRVSDIGSGGSQDSFPSRRVSDASTLYRRNDSVQGRRLRRDRLRRFAQSVNNSGEDERSAISKNESVEGEALRRVASSGSTGASLTDLATARYDAFSSATVGMSTVSFTNLSIQSGSTISKLAWEVSSVAVDGADATISPEPSTMYQIARSRGRDLTYYSHYRGVLVYNMRYATKFYPTCKPFCHSPLEVDDPFEVAAAVFRPLYHAMLALSAASLARREQRSFLDSLEHRQMAIEGLKAVSEPSVHLLYTQYFLLMYEIAAAEEEGNLEMPLLDRTCKLILWYWTTNAKNPAALFQGPECRYCSRMMSTFITTFACYMTWFALLMNRTATPHLPDVFYRAFFDSVARVVDDAEAEYPTVVHESAFQSDDAIYQAVLTANRLQGLSGHKVSALKEYVNCYVGDEPIDLDEGFLARSKDANDTLDAAYESLRQESLLPSDIYDEHYTTLQLPFQTKMDSLFTLMSMSFIYVRTSLYPQQRASLSSAEEARVQEAALEIMTTIRPRWGEMREVPALALYALFFCGIVLLDHDLQTELLKYLVSKDKDASGRAYARVVEALKTLWELQSKVEDPRTIDWWIELRDRKMLGFCPFGL